MARPVDPTHHSRRAFGLLVFALLALACTHHRPPSSRDIACNATRNWMPGLRDEAKQAARELLADAEAAGAELSAAEREQFLDQATDVVMWRMVRAQLLGGGLHNFATVPLTGVRTASGRPVVLYRTGLTADPEAPDSCFRSLIEDGGVRHVVNLYGGDLPSRDLIAAESRAIADAGGTYFDANAADERYLEWRDRLRDSSEATPQVSEVVADLINEQILRPGGDLPQGNVHVHCGGGMHRTGMIVGILQRCLNGDSDPQVIADYRRHVDWQSEDQPGGAEAGNLDFILGFDCGLLKAPTRR